MFEELDSPNEFFIDTAAMRLYYFYNGTGAPPDTWTWEVPLLSTLIAIDDPSHTASGITLTNLTFTSTAPTFLQQHGTPSGGDWGLARTGVVYLHGTTGATVSNCLFTRVDGTAIFIDRWNRGAVVDGNTFIWLGESAVASWGAEDGVDGTAEDVPLGNSVTNNICTVWVRAHRHRRVAAAAALRVR